MERQRTGRNSGRGGGLVKMERPQDQNQTIRIKPSRSNDEARTIRLTRAGSSNRDQDRSCNRDRTWLARFERRTRERRDQTAVCCARELGPGLASVRPTVSKASVRANASRTAHAQSTLLAQRLMQTLLSTTTCQAQHWGVSSMRPRTRADARRWSGGVAYPALLFAPNELTLGGNADPALLPARSGTRTRGVRLKHATQTDLELVQFAKVRDGSGWTADRSCLNNESAVLKHGTLPGTQRKDCNVPAEGGAPGVGCPPVPVRSICGTARVSPRQS